MVNIQTELAKHKREGKKDFGVNLLNYMDKQITITAAEYGLNDDDLEFVTVILNDGTKAYTFSKVVIDQLKLCKEVLDRGETLEGVLTCPRGKRYYTFL